VKIVVVGTE
jgi:hypothetical protein